MARQTTRSGRPYGSSSASRRGIVRRSEVAPQQRKAGAPLHAPAVNALKMHGTLPLRDAHRQLSARCPALGKTRFSRCTCGRVSHSFRPFAVPHARRKQTLSPRFTPALAPGSGCSGPSDAARLPRQHMTCTGVVAPQGLGQQNAIPSTIRSCIVPPEQIRSRCRIGNGTALCRPFHSNGFTATSPRRYNTLPRGEGRRPNCLPHS